MGRATRESVMVCGSVGGGICSAFPGDMVASFNGSGILAGTYYLLYVFSHEKLVGGGDWILCLAVALILGNWWLALVELFLANLFASLAAVVGRALGQKKKKQIYFGPFLVMAMVTILLFQEFLLKALAF